MKLVCKECKGTGQLLNVQPTPGDFAAINAIKLMRDLNYQKQKKQAVTVSNCYRLVFLSFRVIKFKNTNNEKVNKRRKVFRGSFY